MQNSNSIGCFVQDPFTFHPSALPLNYAATCTICAGTSVISVHQPYSPARAHLGIGVTYCMRLGMSWRHFLYKFFKISNPAVAMTSWHTMIHALGNPSSEVCSPAFGKKRIRKHNRPKGDPISPFLFSSTFILLLLFLDTWFNWCSFSLEGSEKYK